jgi:hypothetical protein
MLTGGQACRQQIRRALICLRHIDIQPQHGRLAVLMLPINAASLSRGHGHCPTCRRLFSSMATMVTGWLCARRGSSF